MFVALCSDKGSPGTTITALALASAWPEPAVVVEADAYGGDLAIRLRTQAGDVLPETPTVLTLATAARTSRDSDVVTRYAQRINDQVAVVTGHLLAEQSAGTPDWRPLASLLAASAGPVFADLGRLHSASPLLPLAAAADLLIVVGRAEGASLIRMRERLARLVPVVATLRDGPPRVFAIVVGADRHRAADIADVRLLLGDTGAGPLLLGVGHLAFDLAAVDRLLAGEDPHAWLARTALLRSARRTATELTNVVTRVEARR